MEVYIIISKRNGKDPAHILLHNTKPIKRKTRTNIDSNDYSRSTNFPREVTVSIIITSQMFVKVYIKINEVLKILNLRYLS